MFTVFSIQTLSDKKLSIASLLNYIFLVRVLQDIFQYLYKIYLLKCQYQGPPKGLIKVFFEL
jgi:hypothetical protein